MILCVTLNSCLDKTLIVPPWIPGDQVRGQSMREVVGGKGNNVARALKRLGRDARPVVFLGGAIGQWCETLMRRDDGFDPIIVPTEASTRTILTIRPDAESPTNSDAIAEATAFFDPDPAITADEAHQMITTVESQLQSGNVEALAMSGSSPSDATHGVYSELIALAKARRIPVFLDTYGPALKAIWGFWPDVIQLNRREAGLHLDAAEPTDQQLYNLLDLWASRGVQTGIITNGPNEILVRIDNRRVKATPPEIEPINPIGSGDCLMAGMMDAWLTGLDPHASVQRGVSLAVANAMVWDAGAIESAILDAVPPAEIVDFQISRDVESRGTSLRRGWMVPKRRNRPPAATPSPDSSPTPSSDNK